MGRNRDKKNKDLPNGVYQDRKTYRYKKWDGETLVSYGCGYKTPEEADYKGFLLMNGHHWKGMNKGNSFGFIYKITNRKTGKMYIGSKQFLLWGGPPGGYKCSDMEDPRFDKDAWRPNNWETYTGSQDDLNAEIKRGNVWDYTYEVMSMCKDKMDIHLSEIFEHLERDVLEATNSEGEYLYYNKNIAGVDYRAPFKMSDMMTVRAADEVSMRNYYLKPSVDAKGNVIPYGRPAPSVSLETGGFKDVR